MVIENEIISIECIKCYKFAFKRPVIIYSRVERKKKMWGYTKF